MSRKKSGGLRFQTGREPAREARAPGHKQQLGIERLAHDGRGIAFAAGRTWFVAGALPGEQVSARVLSSRGTSVDAICASVLQAAGNRQQPFCPLAGRCGGCTLQHMPMAQQRQFKQEHLLSALDRAGIAGPPPEPMLMASGQAYRRRTRLAVQVDKKGTVQLGFRALSSRQIVPVASCPILVAQLQPVLAGLGQQLAQLQQPLALGHIELFYGNQAAMLVRLVRKLPEPDRQQLRDYCQQQATQLWWQEADAPYPDQPQNRVFYSLPAHQVEIDYQPGDFVQGNAALNAQMVDLALEWLQPGADDTLLDLFCGLGNFSLALARHAARVVAVEGVQSMVQRAQSCAQRQGFANVEFYRHDLSASLQQADWAQKHYDLIILDPPRSGAQELVQQLAGFAARKLLYVSCNPATLARDAVELQRQGYQMQRLVVLDMFSQTGHVEAMALF